MLDRRSALAMLAAAAAAPALPACSDSRAARWSGHDGLVDEARRLASLPHRPRSHVPLPEMSYDTYRDIAFRPERAVALDRWRAQFFHLGWLFRTPIRVHRIEDDRAVEIAYDRRAFRALSGDVAIDRLPDGIGWSGLRLHHPAGPGLPEDEFLVFQGASYLRGRGAGCPAYGLSARGLAVDCGLDRPEEFPAFTAFWLEPAVSGAVVVHALLDSPRATGAYRFEAAQGEPLTLRVTATVFARDEAEVWGLAPLTSMYSYGVGEAAAVGDARPRVHDSDGLLLVDRDGGRTWRPLANPSRRRLSIMALEDPRGFGLLQRERRFSQYDDPRTRYDGRPHGWVEPAEPWGRGRVWLVELPAPDETYDNIVAFWQPERPPGRDGLRFDYRLSFGRDEPDLGSTSLVRATATRTRVVPGRLRPDAAPAREVLVDWEPGPHSGDTTVEVRVGNAVRSEPVLVRDIGTGGWRSSWLVEPLEPGPVELEAVLRRGGAPVSETWRYRLDELRSAPDGEIVTATTSGPE